MKFEKTYVIVVKYFIWVFFLFVYLFYSLIIGYIKFDKILVVWIVF